MDIKTEPAPEFEERISLGTDPSIVAEHIARYRFALPVIKAGKTWIDLGCGDGLAAHEAAGNEYTGDLILVDNSGSALNMAAQRFEHANLELMEGDLSDEGFLAELLERIGEEKAGPIGSDATGGCCITCFEVIEHLESFASLVGFFKKAHKENATIVLSVPNDSLWAMHNPHHKTMWSGSALEEFRRLLPKDQVVYHQSPLQGTAIADPDSISANKVEVEIGDNSVPSHYIVAFGLHKDLLTGFVEISQSDQLRERAWVHQRESDLTSFKVHAAKSDKLALERAKIISDLERKVAEYGEQLEKLSTGWRSLLRRLVKRR